MTGPVRLREFFCYWPWVDFGSERGRKMPERVRERDLVIPAMRAAAANGGTITTTTLIDVLTHEFEPTGTDAEILDGRHDTYFSQKVRNLISHRENSTSMFSRRYAVYDASSESISLTEEGRNFLDQVPE
jgi:hypothetical protein